MSLKRVALVGILSCFAASIHAQEKNLVSGVWQGQVQWHANIQGKADPVGHSVGSIVISVDPKGRIDIVSSDAGCRGVGIFSDGVMPIIKTLDIMMNGCRYEGYNRRFNGTMGVQEHGRKLKISLQSQSVEAIGKYSRYEIKGALLK